jgi:uncharacterized iron-regulated membrane protein
MGASQQTAIRGPYYYGLFWRWHFFAAALVIPFVLWQSTTGALYLWSEWWMDVRHPELRFVSPTPTPAPYATQVSAALATVPDAPVQEIFIPTDRSRSTTVLLLGQDGLPIPVFVDPNGPRVLGQLSSSQWLPGVSRALHRGWPFGDPGNWLLELGDCWAIVMLLTGLYLWWPRERSFASALVPRFHLGPKILLRDLHSCVAVWFSAVFLFFLVSALPWTHFWGGVILPKVQSVLNQESPAGFSIGITSPDRMKAALPTLDAVVQEAQAQHVSGTLDIKLDEWQGAPWWLTNLHNAPGTDRYIIGDTQNGDVLGSYVGSDLPLIPAAVALGIHLHQGDFGPINLWLNTALAGALIWLSATGFLSWWHRRPQGQLGAPPAVRLQWPPTLVCAAATLSVALPLFGLSILMLAILERGLRQFQIERKEVV